MSKKRFLSIVLSAVMILSLACSALAVGQSGRYIGNSTVNGSIYQTYYQVDAQTRTGIKVSAFPVLSMKRNLWNMAESKQLFKYKHDLELHGKQ